ncbi:hypothetical protein [Streptomyces erythrochromogenes]|uniref:hypothetical protein n=1 Tax=Streptomyces erythrochromogenes TaxID=285574 RepID=UPI0038681A8F|nr:helix-turn-helix domain-containing protein [Streptomyces erythrochromogenes]
MHPTSINGTEPHALIGPLILEEAPIGSFGLWDHLVTSGPTLRESLAQAVDLIALSLFPTRARSATGRDLVPSQVTVTHRAPRRARHPAQRFGTDRIHFGAPYDSISFTEEDVRVPLPAVAGRVGYSDVSVLRRAVRRWSGKPPAELRRAAPG